MTSPDSDPTDFATADAFRPWLAKRAPAHTELAVGCMKRGSGMA